MRRVLGIEWDHEQLRVLEAVSRGGKVEVRRAFAWPETVQPNPLQAEEAGQRLRQRLKEAGVAPAPAYFVVGRERLLFREVRYPDVPAAEVAAVVHFQASKELNFPADESVVDFALNNVPGPLGEKRALAVVLRKELLSAIQKTCKVAGLKLEGVAARPFAVLAGWVARQPQTAAAGDVEGILIMNGTAAELCVARGKELLFSRNLSWETDAPAAAELTRELRRTQAAYATQFPHHPLRSLHVAGANGSEVTQSLAASLRLPVTGYDPLAGLALPQLPGDDRSGFAGALGAVHYALAGKRPPIEFLRPKEAHPKDNRKRSYILGGIAAAVLLIGGALTFYGLAVAAKNSRIEELQTQNAQLVKQVGAFGDLDKRMEKINEWAGGEIVVLDDFYDLVAHFPHQPGVRITKVGWSPINEPGRMAAQPVKPAAGAAKPLAKPATEKPIGVLNVEASGDAAGLAALRRAFQSGRQWKEENWDTSTAGQVKASFKVYRQKPTDYGAQLTLPTTASETRGRGERGGRP